MYLFLNLDFNKIEFYVKFDIFKIEFYVYFQVPIKFSKKFKWQSMYKMLSSTCNSILLKSSLKNSDILLNSFKTGVFSCIVCKFGANAHFHHDTEIIIIIITIIIIIIIIIIIMI